MVEHTDLVRSLFDEDKTVRRKSGEALAKLGSTALVALLEGMLASPDAGTRAAAVRAMGQFAAAPLIPLLERVAAGQDAALAKLAVAALDRQAARKKGAPRAGPGRTESATTTCPGCGDPAPATAYWCPRCNEQLRPEVEPTAGPVGIEVLGDWRARTCAAFADIIYAFGFAILSLLVPPLRGTGGAIYNLFKDGLRGGQSWGKAQFRLRVVDATTGEPATLMQSLARNVIFLLPPVALIEFALVASSGIRIGDRIANTRVVSQ